GRDGEGRRGNGALDAAGTRGSPVLKHGPMTACGGGGRERPRISCYVMTRGDAGMERWLQPPRNRWNAMARGDAGMGRWMQQQRLVHPCSSTGL
ncbi:MAG: hypothetical protein QGG36_21260, partial [Pirellulaceae bacterium]|nr:hypothetical protein [Pirellulaceae bacterium]